MRIIYIFVLVCLLLYIFFKNRSIDAFTIMSISTFFYTYSTFWGYILVDNRKIVLDVRVYNCLLIFAVLLLLFIVISDSQSVVHPLHKEINHKAESPPPNNYANLIVAIIGLFLMLYTIQLYGNILGTALQKNELLMNANKGTEYFKYVSTFVFTYSFTNTGKYIKVSRFISTFLMIYTIILGHRSFVAIAIIAIGFGKIAKKTNGEKVSLAMYLARHKWITLMSAGFILTVFLIKGISVALIAGYYDLVLQRLTSTDYYVESITSSETNAIMRNLQYACTSDMGYRLYDYIVSFLSLIPFVGGYVNTLLGGQSFSDLLNLKYNERYSEGFGLGATFLGEAYSAGWYILLLFAIIGLFILVRYMNKKFMLSNNTLVKNFFAIGCVYLTFYFHRNTFIFSLTTIRAYLYILLLGIIIKNIFPIIVIRKQR